MKFLYCIFNYKSPLYKQRDVNMKTKLKLVLLRVRSRKNYLICRYWHAGIKLWWNCLWVREDEFHPSLNSDFRAMIGMTDEELEAYQKNLVKRRDIAHRRDLDKNKMHDCSIFFILLLPKENVSILFRNKRRYFYDFRFNFFQTAYTSCCRMNFM